MNINWEHMSCPWISFLWLISYTLKLPSKTTFQQIKISYLTDINIYIHYKNQFLYNWKDDKNMIAASTALNFNTKENSLHDLKINFILEKQIGLPDFQRFSYDECLLNLKIRGKDSVRNLITSNELTSSIEKQQEFVTLTNELYQTISYPPSHCNPVDYINIKKI